MRRRAAVLLVALATLAHAEPPAADPAAPLPLSSVLPVLEKRRPLSPDDLASYTAAVDAAAATHPGDATYARALLLVAQGKWRDARDMLRPAVKARPNDARTQSLLGTAVFSTIMTESTLDQMSLADEAVAAYQAAAKLDPLLIEPRVGLAQFYINAPGIAGGSYRKARAQAEELLAMKDGVGEFNGRLILAQIAQSRERWDEMAEQYTLAQSARGSGASPLAARVAHAAALLRAKKDPAAAIRILDQIPEDEARGSVQAQSLRGQALVALKRHAEARPYLERAIELDASTASGRFALAQACEALGDIPAAVTHYRAYLERAPKGPRAEDATKALKRLEPRPR